MALSKYKLGQFIERSTGNNRLLTYGEELIVGVTSEGVFSSPKGNVKGVDLQPYKIVRNGDFVYNPSRFDLGSIAYRTEGLCIVSHLYQVFHLNEEGKNMIDPNWLFIYLRRDEFKREVSFRNFGSQRPEFNFNDLSEIELPLPSLERQKKYVAMYQAACDNLKAYESRLDSLKFVCDGYIDNIKHSAERIIISEILETVDERNEHNLITEVKGINITKDFMPSVANVDQSSIHKYKVVRPGYFAFSGMQTGRDKCIRIALNKNTQPLIVSPAYTTLKLKNDNVEAKYIMLWFSREESDRYGWFASDGSVRSNLDLDRFFDIKIPIPSIDIQRDIINIYQCYLERKQIAEQMREKIKNLCPVLIRGSLQE